MIKTTGNFAYGSVQWYTSNIGGANKPSNQLTADNKHQYTPKPSK